YAAVGAHDALEAGRLGDVAGGVRVLPDRIVALEIGERQVVRVHVLAGRDVLARHADDLVVAPHRLAGGDGAHGHLVARRHQAGHADAFGGQRRAAHQLAPRDDDVVGGVDADDGVVAGRVHGVGSCWGGPG